MTTFLSFNDKLLCNLSFFNVQDSDLHNNFCTDMLILNEVW
jgi:hypothetical protein